MTYETYLNENNPKLELKVKDFGTIELQLFPEVAENTVKNFLSLINENYFEGLTFHRIIKGFMLQGGWGKKEIPSIRGEFKQNGYDNPLIHSRGVISMARTSDPNSASSQFFIMHKDSPHLDGAYAAFGAVTKGLDVVDKIALVPTNYQDQPKEKVVIESFKLI
ncbi:peptidylprolyl isomerase [Mycoplasmatota bacterium]|nr:peptidylprolyl isomerase [Mycoplasmatota bacterium]